MIRVTLNFLSPKELLDFNFKENGEFVLLKPNDENEHFVNLSESPWKNVKGIKYGDGTHKYIFDTSRFRSENFPFQIKFPLNSDLSIGLRKDVVLGGPIKYRALGRISFILNDLL